MPATATPEAPSAPAVPVETFLSSLSRRSLTLRREGESLVLGGDPAQRTDRHRAYLRTNKPVILAYLTEYEALSADLSRIAALADQGREERIMTETGLPPQVHPLLYLAWGNLLPVLPHPLLLPSGFTVTELSLHVRQMVSLLRYARTRPETAAALAFTRRTVTNRAGTWETWDVGTTWGEIAVSLAADLRYLAKLHQEGRPI